MSMIMLHSFQLRKMLMSSIILLLLLLLLPHLHALNCYSTKRLNFTREDFHWENILDHINHSIISNVSTCHLRITVDYHTKRNPYLVIQFQPVENSLPTHIEFGTTIDFHPKSQQTMISYFDYRCSSGDSCERNFLQTWSKEYLQNANNSLHRNLLSAWANPIACEEKSRTNYCESYLCFTVYHELQNLSYGKFQCHDRLSTNPVHIHIKTRSGNVYQEYQCQKNHCTGEVFYNSLMETNSPRMRNLDRSTNEIIFKRAMMIIGLLLCIGLIAYYIQCRKYKQGYRLTRNA